MDPKPLGKSRGGVNFCLFAPPGTGKTTLIGTGPKTLIIHPPVDHTDSIVLPADVREIVVRDHNDLADALRWVQQDGHKEIDWAWLDSISLMEDVGLDDVFQVAVDRKPSRKEYGPDKGEYGINRGRLMRWVRDMMGLASSGLINFGVTAQPMEVWDPVIEEDIWLPAIGSQNNPLLAIKFCGYMNIVAYLKKTERDGKPATRRLMTEAKGFYGKDQITRGKLNNMRDPDMSKILDEIKRARGRRPTRRPRKTRRKGGS